MKFGLEFVPEDPVEEIVEKAKLADDQEFDYIWITDHYNNRNVYIVLTRIVEETEQIKLGPGVTNPYTVNPAETASAIATLDEISDGRAVLGIGPGDKTTLNSLGIEWDKPLTRTKESITVIEKLLNGETVSCESMEKNHMKRAELNFEPKGEIPIYVGAQGPNMLKMAGERGDGVLVNASHPADFDFAVAQIEKGVEKGGRSISEVDITAYTSFSIAKTSQKAKEAVIPPVAFITASVSEKILERHEISKEDAKEVENYLNNGDYGESFGSVTDEMIDAFALYGTPEECLSRIKELKEVGVTQVVAGSPLGPDKEEAIKMISEEIISKF